MVYEFKVVSRSESSEIFEFNCHISLLNAAGLELKSITFQSNLDCEIPFKITVVKEEKSDPICGKKTKMKVGLGKIDTIIKCDIRALLIIEILNNAGQLYLKESLETQFSQSSLECFSDSFDFPMADRAVRGSKGDMYFRGNTFQIKGKVILQDCRKKVTVPATLCEENIRQLQSDFKDSFLSNAYADIEFNIESEIIYAHKNILSSRSIIFRNMFEKQYKRRKGNKSNTMKENESKNFEITGIDKSVFNVFLIFLYTGILQDKKLEVVMPLYSVAVNYAVETLLETCRNLLNEYISDTSVAPILKLAETHKDVTLKEKAVNFICKNFATVEATESWNTLLDSDPRLTSCILRQVATTLAKLK